MTEVEASFANEVRHKEKASAVPFDAAELRTVFVRPLRVLDIVFSDRKRLAETIAEGKVVHLLTAVLLYGSVLFALPYGAVLAREDFWKVAVVFVGSLGICLPSLQVFGSYVGLRIGTGQNLALGLVITSVAALFTFGFFPILWFLRATMLEDSTVTPSHLSVILLVFSLLAGIVHLYRCLPRFVGAVSTYVALTLFWQVLFIFITHRMARLLEVW